MTVTKLTNLGTLDLANFWTTITSRQPSITAIMSDNGEVEVENPSGYQVLPKEVTSEIGSVKLFNKWSYEDVEIRDISLTYVYPACSLPDYTHSAVYRA